MNALDAFTIDPFALPALVILIALTITAVVNLLGRIRIWEHGRCRDRPARRDRITGEVQFVLWKAGEQGHQQDYWHRFDSYWWDQFKR